MGNSVLESPGKSQLVSVSPGQPLYFSFVLHLSFGQMPEHAGHIVQRVDAVVGEFAVLNSTAGQRFDQANQFEAIAQLIAQVALDEAGKLFVYERGERLLLREIVNLFGSKIWGRLVLLKRQVTDDLSRRERRREVRRGARRKDRRKEPKRCTKDEQGSGFKRSLERFEKDAGKTLER